MAYDYIIVGGGSAGCVLEPRRADSPREEQSAGRQRHVLAERARPSRQRSPVDHA